jgi:hypothetical protein
VEGRVASARKTNTRSEDVPTKDKIVKAILGSYRPTRGSRLFAEVWGDMTKTGWLNSFAEAIAGDNRRWKAWKTIKKKCNTSFVMEHLYVVTFPGKHPGEKRTSANKAFKTQVNKIIRGYDKLRVEIFALGYVHEILSFFSAGRMLKKELQKLQESKQRLEARGRKFAPKTRSLGDFRQTALRPSRPQR